MPLVDLVEHNSVDSVAVAESVQSPPNQSPTLRKFFPETWIWECRDARLVYYDFLSVCAEVIGKHSFKLVGTSLVFLSSTLIDICKLQANVAIHRTICPL